MNSKPCKSEARRGRTDGQGAREKAFSFNAILHPKSPGCQTRAGSRNRQPTRVIVTPDPQDAMRPIELVLSRLPGAKVCSGGWMAKCPAHSDEHPSLSISEGADGTVLLCCHAGCENKDVVPAMGLRMSDLYLDGHGPAEKKRIVATYDYRDKDGTVRFQTVRYANPKDFRQRQPKDGGGWIWSLTRPPVKRVLYRLPELQAADPAQWAFVVEGEKDADNLATLGLTATTNACGAKGWLARYKYPESLRGRKVCILPDNDEAGREHGLAVGESLHGIAKDVRILELPGLPPAGDVSDWIEAGGTAEELLKLADSAPAFVPAPTPPGSAEAVDCLDKDEAGDATLFCKMFQGQLVYDPTERCWYRFGAHHWEEDETNQVCRLVTDELAARYLEAAAEVRKAGRIELSDRLATRACQLRARRRVDNVLYLAARRELAFDRKKREWDADPWVLGCSNGVINLKDGTFRAGRPDDYIRCASPTEWRGLKTPAPLWKQFQRDVFDGDAEMINFVQRLLGYAITGLRQEHKFPIAYGEMGRNGKGTMLEATSAVLGDDLTMPCPADALMEASRPRSGEAASPFLYSLRGKRLVWASESREGRRVNTDMIKLLCGGDKVPCRPLFGKATKFVPTHTLILLTNTKPRVPSYDQPVWDRIMLIPFTQRFVDDPGPGEHQADKEMLDKLAGEASGILAWLARGCLRWQKYGLRPPGSVMAATKEYRQEEDILAAFLVEQCCTGKGHQVKNGDLYRAYCEWSKERNETPLTGQMFGRRMASRFKFRESHGRIYQGVGLLSVKTLG